ncbi:GNAT family N-acetyltransferase [Streptomyces sp. 8ZJF_21]|uniref:GNAT family N-acetyltransferase n=1 Tax=Streptomyces autolyticus TaxID=75293 RepID=A0ABM6H6R0_9ACTN|nr:GNAT family N-acetyltransferase [Streptomyces autolyticus]MCD9586461.1 GNAT family N-acetyltransferase [Streptomyces sp. 8ZJF_21]MCQ6246420.1 GNAT family N-acetyltransferase [Streptomyces malaysiensis]
MRPTPTKASEDTTLPSHPLDNAIHSALSGPHAHLARRRGNALRYTADMSPFMALPDSPGAADWANLAALAGPGARVTLSGPVPEPPDGWQVEARIPLLQFTGGGIATAPDEEAVRLHEADVPEMLTLAELTRPGPFLKRTIEMGTYLGIRRNGRLVAMAGERLRVPGWTEISGVCTDPGSRGQGLGTRLLLAVAEGIRERGETPFLHVLASNASAIRLYESLGFRLRLRTGILALTCPPA